MKRLLFPLLLVLPVTVGGQEPLPDDIEIARDAVERGEILPLAAILPVIQKDHPGRVIEIELEFSDGIRVYEIEIVTPDGRLIELDVDARTGTLVAFEEEDEEDDDR